jgi:hypothetical protein
MSILGFQKHAPANDRDHLHNTAAIDPGGK